MIPKIKQVSIIFSLRAAEKVIIQKLNTAELCIVEFSTDLFKPHSTENDLNQKWWEGCDDSNSVFQIMD